MYIALSWWDDNPGRHFPHPAVAKLLWSSQGTEAEHYDKSKRSSLRPFMKLLILF